MNSRFNNNKYTVVCSGIVTYGARHRNAKVTRECVSIEENGMLCVDRTDASGIVDSIVER
jgi:hypothetical protein